MCKMEGFYRKKDRVRELLAKEKKGLLLGQDIFWVRGEGMARVLSHTSPLGDGEGLVTDYLIGADPKIPAWLIKITFLGNVETVIRSGNKSRFGIMGFSTGDAICGL